MKRFALLMAILLALPGAAFSEQFAKVGTFGGQFLKIGVSARAAGMGSAYTGVADDANSVFWNPGGLVNVVTNEVALNHVEWPADIKLTSLVLATNPRSIPGTIALSARSLWLDPMPVRTAYEPDGNGQHFDAGAETFGLSYARFFTDKFSAGFTLNYVHEGLAETAVNTLGFDFGIMYRIGVQDLQLGMVIQNLGGKMTFDETESKMPTTFKVGASFVPVRTDHHKILFASEFSHPSDNKERANLGGEYTLNDTFHGRLGYHVNYDTEGLAFGFGAALRSGKTNKLQLDYAAVDMGPLQYVHRLSLSVIY
ncbi:MAG TPA: PorV/PorQ family protein [Candidatus Krumholzibacteria bacterium]|nr:PorV/PorQ family protein [Candidatus Krumholzibacteria bacterium]HPD71345.1 PorV/PorQ family protein [Candidatus Krumholzibacteria bacterium]HRY38955.1 PorV/PorQ family protein [Candidatus Krumholzibacteria bacterium]